MLRYFAVQLPVRNGDKESEFVPISLTGGLMVQMGGCRRRDKECTPWLGI